jgi:sulfate adenylyltransferase subunit 2
MKVFDQKAGLIYATMPEYKYRVKGTNWFIQKALTEVKNPYLACSFGKDSTVMLHLVLLQFPEIPIRFATHPETEILDNYREVIDWWKEKFDINLTEVFCDGELVKVKHHQRKMLGNVEADAFFVGLRADESVARRMSLRKYGKFHQLKSSGVIRIAPLADWTERDIAAYIYSNDLPLLSAYGFHGVDTRTSAGIPRSCIDISLNNLKLRDIGRFNRLCELYPDARYYV